FADDGWKVETGLIHVELAHAWIGVEIHADYVEALIVIGAIVLKNVRNLGPTGVAEAGKKIDQHDFPAVRFPIDLRTIQQRALDLQRLARQGHEALDSFVRWHDALEICIP